MAWDSFTQKILINSTKEKLYAAFASRTGMESWFLRVCDYNRQGQSLRGDEFAKVDDDYTFLWHGWPDETIEKGKVIQANGDDVFEFTFDGNGSTKMVVLVTLKEMNSNVLVTLLQYNIPETDEGKMNWHVGCKTGWNFYLTNLKAILEHGVDLRNKDVLLKGVLNS